MSAILTILGRATRDPEMQQGKNSGTEYVSLDIAVSQRGQDGKEETIYYQCYFNKFLAERLAKAGVKKGTGLMIYGDLELHPFIYQKGKNAGQANAGPRINVKDWHFVPSNRSDSNTGHPGANQNSQPNGGAATPGAAGNGSYPMQGNPNGSYQNQAMPGGYPQQGMAPANGAYTPPANGGQYQAPPNGTGQPQSSYPPQGSYTGMPNYGGMPGSQPTDGFQNVPEQMASQFRILNDVAAEKVQEDCQTELTEELQKTANDIHYGNAHAGIHVTIHRLTSVSDYLKNEYQTVAPPLLRASKKLQSTILPLLKEEQQGGKQKNLLFGKRLDSHALYKTDGTIFTRTRLPGEEKRLAVALLIDESGSMGWGDRMTHARKTAIVLYDFCKSLGIPITIYGHSTDAGGVALYSYAEFDSVDNEDCYRLMDMCDRNGNRDGAALRFVAEHLCTRPELQKLLILISDGQPADYGYSGTEAEADLRGIKKEYEKRDVILFAAAIGDDKENIRRIYKDGFLDITKLEELPKNMAQLVKQHLK